MREIRFRKKKRRTSALNTTSTADISFILLIFFLVTTSLDTDYGLVRQLPPMPHEDQQELMDVEREHVIEIDISADDIITIDGRQMPDDSLSMIVKDFIMKLPKKNIVSIHADSASSYDRYFFVQNTIVDIYRNLRDTYCYKYFNRPFSRCSAEDQELAQKAIPQRISEQIDTHLDNNNTETVVPSTSNKAEMVSAAGKTMKGGKP